MNSSIQVSFKGSPSGVAVSSSTLEEISDACIEARCERARQAGREEAGVELSGGAGKALDAAARMLDEAREEAEQKVAGFAIELAVEIARLLTRSQLEAGQYDIERIVRETLAASGVGRAPCVVHLCPGDIERLDGVPFRAGTVLEADPNLSAGDVHVTTPQGLIVRELDSCLDAIRDGLFGELD